MGAWSLQIRGLGSLLVLQVLMALFAREPCSGQSAPSDALDGKSSQSPDTEQEAVPRSIPDRPPYQMDRSEENWTFLQDSSLRSDFWDPIKYIRLGPEGWYMSLGGEFRPMYEFDKNYNWGEGPQDHNGFYLNRLIGSADFHFGSHARVFFELKSGLEFGRNGGPRPSIDEDKLDLSQLFVDVPISKERLPLVIRVGRQELSYGEGSLLAIRELNVRREFDGFKVLFRPEGWSVDAFAVRPVTTKPGFFDDPADHQQTLWGVWASTTENLPKPLTQLDLYYLGLDRKKATFNQGTAREQRHTLGINLHGRKDDLFFFVEGDVQFGKFGSGQILAWKIAPMLGYAFPNVRFHPALSVQGAISSGDKNPADPDLQTFNPLFPKGLYYGYMDFVSGSLNAIVVRPMVSLQVSRSVSLTPDSFFFWRRRASDGLYSQGGVFLRTGQDTRARYIGAEQNLDLVWRVDRHTIFQFIAAYYEVGPYLRQTPPAGRNATHFSAKMNYKF